MFYINLIYFHRLHKSHMVVHSNCTLYQQVHSHVSEQSINLKREGSSINLLSEAYSYPAASSIIATATLV